MEKDFHYFMVYTLARTAEVPDAGLVAYASQFVDDNNEGQFSVDGKPVGFPEKLRANGGHYFPIMTQSLSVTSLNPYVHKYVYVPFHFLPGDGSVVIKGQRNPLSTTPGSPNARKLLRYALNSADPYLLGIAMHTYIDTWAHQNFSGVREGWNSVYPWYNVFKSVAPNIGHAEAGHSPDVLSEAWTDHRLDNGTIKNWERGLEAASSVYQILRRRTGKGPIWSDIRKPIRDIINTKRYDGRIAAMAAFLAARGLGEIPRYDPNRWIDEALDRVDGKVTLSPRFVGSHWHRFHQAAKRQLSFVLNLVQDL